MRSSHSLPTGFVTTACSQSSALISSIESNTRGLACCLEPQLRIDDLKAGPVALGFEAERQSLAVFGRREQTIAAAGGMRFDACVAEARRLGERDKVLSRNVRHAPLLPSRRRRPTSSARPVSDASRAMFDLAL
jgi:hypothetical protein